MEFMPELLGERVVRGAFADFAVAVNFLAVDPAEDDVRALASAFEERLINGAGEFLGVGVEAEGAPGAVWEFLRFFAAAVRRGENHGQGADPVLDVLVAPIEDLGRRLRIGGAKQPDGEPHQGWGKEKAAEEVGHSGEYGQG